MYLMVLCLSGEDVYRSCNVHVTDSFKAVVHQLQCNNLVIFELLMSYLRFEIIKHFTELPLRLINVLLNSTRCDLL